MLSIERCRQLLGPSCRHSDSDLDRLREDLYGLARASVAAYQTAGNQFEAGHYEPAVAELSAEEREAVDERAAILEYEAGLSRSEAERRALATWIEKDR